MNVVKEIQRINQRELTTSEGWDDSRSWHAQYKDTSWIFVANLDYDLTEGDVVCIFSQYGEPLNIEMARDQKTGKSMGFAFLQYENQKSAVLAVDNMNGSSVLSRTLRVDHSYGPKKKKREEEDDETYAAPVYNVAPPTLDVTDDEDETPREKTSTIDEEDPMAAYFQNKKKKEEKKKKKSKDHHHRHHHKRKSSDRREHHSEDSDYHDTSRRKDSADNNDHRRKRKYSNDSR